MVLGYSKAITKSAINNQLNASWNPLSSVSSKKISQNNLSSNNIDMDMYIVNRLLEINKDIFFFSLSLSADIWPDPYSEHNKM